MVFSLGKAKEKSDQPNPSGETDRWWNAFDSSPTGTPSQVETPVADYELDSWLEGSKVATKQVSMESQYGQVRATTTSSGSQPEQISAPRVTSRASTPEEEIKQRFGSTMRSALGAGTVIEGKLSFDSPVRIDGTLKGEVISTSTLVVGEQAVVEGTLQVGNVIILGQVFGNVTAEGKVEIKAGGHLFGDVLVHNLVIDDGGEYEGTCSLHK
jgi:cytoskeletal protein CcmA (bactofilin family)